MPLELQRRIINDAFSGGRYGPIAVMCAAYLCFALTEGLLKLVLNVYRGRVGERAVRWLRTTILRRGSTERSAELRGIEMSMVLAEADPIGGFIGSSLSEPVLQGGILVSTLVYLTYLQPLMAIISFGVLCPQILFIPVMQEAINKRVQARIATLRDVSGSMITSEKAEALQHRRLKSVFSLNVSVYRLKFSMNFFMNLLNHLGITAILALGGYFVVKGQTEIGTVVAFVSGLARINDPWGDLVNWFRDLKMTQVKYELVYAALENGKQELPE
ncbi:ABC transporter ATP-binding protein [Microvirga flavescens]|uniref:ABC transporter ATP-binding protein n=1 Tax=Microvirga flavescens TaxID=2249811 RepID=UPI001300B1EA|nr:ABC transporter ATP-binding protein [Microvirga flavescens]